jgi:GNAT superfamily N-acetyltransferase
LRTALPDRGTVAIHVAGPADEGPFSQMLGAAFAEIDEWRTFTPPFSASLGVPDILGCIAMIDDEPAGGGMLGMIDGVAMLSGDGVLPRFRGHGLQKALIAWRLHWAAEHGCDVACAGTLPMTPSQRAYEACGFRAAYPKLEMMRG